MVNLLLFYYNLLFIIMKRILLLIIIITSALFVPLFANAQEGVVTTDETFHARVLEVIDQNNVTNEDKSTIIQQKLRLIGLEGNWKDKEFEFDGTQFEILSAPEYKVGDKVIVDYTKDSDSNDVFFVIDYVRQGSIYLISFIFALVVILVGRLKGLRSLFVLVLTFLVILYFIIPRILDGGNPLIISIIGSLFILFLAIYITEGFNQISTISVISILVALIFTGLLSVWITSLTHLTGFDESAAFITSLSGVEINMQGLLLAGIIIGSLGVLDDVIISQVILVNEFKELNNNLSIRKIYQKAMKVGITHMSAMVNTLFLAYAGAALPLLILFSINQPPFLTFSQVINNEMVATEIVRMITGSIGLVLSIPLATFLASKYIKVKKNN